MIKHAAYKAILATVNKCFGSQRFSKNGLVTRLLWDTAPSNSLLLADGQGKSESFVVAGGDKIIGQWLFKHREPYDFFKLQRVQSMLAARELTLLLDIGANIGTICIPAVNRGLFKRAIAIEPGPLNYSLLRTNIELNRVASSITTYNLAVGEQNDQTLSFQLSIDNFGDHRVRYEGSESLSHDPGESIEVPSQTLDKVLDGVDRSAALLWIDTQGFEGYVLAGATETLRNRPPLVSEFWPAGLSRGGGMDRFKKALVTAGYTQFCNLSTNDSTLRPFSAEALDKVAESLDMDMGQTDLLFV